MNAKLVEGSTNENINIPSGIENIIKEVPLKISILALSKALGYEGVSFIVFQWHSLFKYIQRHLVYQYFYILKARNIIVFRKNKIKKI